MRIEVEGGSLDSDEAQVTFADNQIATRDHHRVAGHLRAEARRTASDIAHGRAGRIEYDFTAGSVRLLEDAYLTDGHNDISGQTLVYSIRDQRVLAEASAQGDERVRITINPRSVEDEQKNERIPRNEHAAGRWARQELSSPARWCASCRSRWRAARWWACWVRTAREKPPPST